MYCWKCGAETEESARFCVHCGAGLEAGQPRRRFRLRPWLIGAILVILILVAATTLILVRVMRPTDVEPVSFSTPGMTPLPPTEVPPSPTLTASPVPTATPMPTASPVPSATPSPIPPAQLQGQVVDEDSGAPLAGAQVSVAERQVMTDEEGRFAVPDLAPGPYTVLVTAEGYDPALSGIVVVEPGEQAVVDAALPASGAGEYPRDPMASNQIDAAGAPTAQEAERLARLQGLQGEVASIREVVLEGDYLVNYKKGETIRAAVAMLHHPGWEVVDEAGQPWYIVRVCGNLAVARRATVEVPAQVVAQPHPVVTVGGGGAVGRACPEEGCDTVAELPTGWHGVALGCTMGCEWLQVQGPGVSGSCWVRAELVQPYGQVSGLPVDSQPGTAWIAYAYEGGIWLIKPDGSDPRRITDAGNYHSPAWSPDGKKIVAVFSPSQYASLLNNLHVIDIATGEVEVFTHYTQEDGSRPAWLGSPDWSPDGRTIVYGQTVDGLARMWDVVTIGADGSRPGQKLPIEQGYSARDPSWAPDGARISYSLIKADPIVDRPLDNWGIWIVGIDGAGARQVTSGIGGSTSWSSDGARILHARGWCLNSDIYVMRADGSSSTQITHDGTSGAPDWSPDDSLIVFMRCPESGTVEIWIMNADGSNPRKLADGGGPAWQPVALLPAPEPEPTPTVQPPTALAEIRWSEPELIGGEGQGGPTQQLLLDQQGQLWAIWEEHVAYQAPDRGYDWVHYRVWDGQAWGELRDIPGSDNYGEPTATLLPDGRILVKAETTTQKPYLWVQWDGSQWSNVPEMASLAPLSEGIRAIAADGHGFVHVMGYPIRTWDGFTWQETEKLGTILYHATALDAEGNLYAAADTLALATASRIRIWTWDGQSWSVSGDIGPPSSQADSGISPPAMAIGPDGIFHVVWRGAVKSPAVTGTTVSYSRSRDDGWSEPQTIFGPVTVGAGFWSPNLAVAPDGTVIVVWGDVQLGEGYRAYATWGREGKWVEPVVISPEDGDQHTCPVVALDAGGRVHVLWKARAGIYHMMGTVIK